MIFKQQLTDISTVLNSTGNTTKLLTSFNALDIAQQKVLLSSSLLSEKQKEQCITMATLSAVNTKYTAEQLAKATGISTETLANWGLIESTDALTISELAQRAASDAQAKAVLDKIIAQNAEAVANGKIIASNTALTASEGGATLATGAFTTAIKANIKAMITWMTTTPLGWLTMLVGSVFLAVKAYDALTVSVKEQKEKMENSLSAYKDAKSELSNITTELENQEQAMDDLLAKEKLTYAEQGQLEELQAITKELRIQKDLAEKEERRTQKEVAKDASDLFNKQFGKYDISESAITEYQNNANITGNNAILISNENDISSMIAGYRQFNDLLDEAYGSESQEDIDHFKSLTEGLKDSIFETAQELQEQQSNIADYYNTIKDIPYDDLTTEQKGIVDSYNSISDAIELIYQQLDSNTWKSMQIESIFDTEGIEKTKEELIKMVKAGEFDESTLQSYPKLSAALEQNKVSASELRNELEALADAEDNVKGDTFNDKNPISISTQLTTSTESLDKFQSSVKSAADAYATLLSGSYSSSDLLDSIQEINQAISDMGGSLNWEFINSQSNSLELLGNAIDHISEKYAESILSDMGIDTDSSFGRMLAENIIQAQKAATQLDVLNGQIDSLQSSYTNLTDIVDTYNRYGYITFDQLQNLLAMEPQYLACLIDENGQLQLNQQALQNLAEMRLYDAKVQAVNQAISELGALTHYDEKKAVEDNAQAFRNSVEDISAYNDELADTIMEAGLAAPLIRDLNTAITGAEERGASDTDIQTVLDNLNAKMKLIGSVANGGLGNILGASSSASKQAETDWKALLDKETDLLEKQLAANVITFREYTDKRRQIIEDYYRDGRIKAEEYYDALESMYANQLSLHDRAVNAVTGRLDEEIDRLKEQKEALESSYQVRIDAIQEEIDALNKANDARKEQIDLEKAQYEAERARKQRVNRSFDGSQFIYEADAEAVRDAEDNLADKEFQLNISRLETQIESLRAEMENAAKSLDIQVEALESYKEKWNEIADSYGEQQDKLIAAEIMGTEWERDILNGRLDTLRSFTEQYIALQQAQADAAVNAARIKAEAGNGNTAGGNVGSVNTVGNVGNAGTGGNGNDDDDMQKYDVVYEGTAKAVRTFNTPEEAQSYANYMNKVHYKDDFMYYVKKYASGTNHAKKGLNLVGEEGTETFIDNDGNISLVTKPTLIPMEGGEEVKDAEETKALLDKSNLFDTSVSVSSEPNEKIKSLLKRMQNVSLSDFRFQSIITPLETAISFPHIDLSPVLSSSTPVNIVQNNTINCPNVTNNSGAEYIMKELKRLPLDAIQFSHRRYK